MEPISAVQSGEALPPTRTLRRCKTIVRKRVMVEIETFATTLQQSMPGIKVTIDPDKLRDYTIDGMLPRMVVTPATTEQVSHVAALANQHDLTILARGGGSRIDLGGIPERVDILVET